MQRRRTSRHQTRNSSGRKSDMYSRDRSSDQLLAIVGKSAIRSATTTIPGGSTQHRDLHLSQLITLLEATRDCQGNFLGLRRHRLNKYPRFTTTPLKNLSPRTCSPSWTPKRCLGRLSIRCDVQQAPITSQTDHGQSWLPNVHRSGTIL
jgi:hypothetical protein